MPLLTAIALTPLHTFTAALHSMRACRRHSLRCLHLQMTVYMLWTKLPLFCNVCVFLVEVLNTGAQNCLVNGLVSRTAKHLPNAAHVKSKSKEARAVLLWAFGASVPIKNPAHAPSAFGREGHRLPCCCPWRFHAFGVAVGSSVLKLRILEINFGFEAAWGWAVGVRVWAVRRSEILGLASSA